MRRFIVLCLFLILSTTGISSAKNSKVKSDEDIAVEDVKDRIREMTSQYSQCAALFIDFMRVEYYKNGESAKYKDYDRRTKLAFVTTEGFIRMYGRDPEGASKAVNDLAVNFIDEMVLGNNKDKFERLNAKCEQITDISEN